MQTMDEGVFDQVTNVATLPGIVKYAYCMPDGHWGYGFPIGGVAAMDTETGVISPGGIGFDINCGMRLVITNLTYDGDQAAPPPAGRPAVRAGADRGGQHRVLSVSPRTNFARLSNEGAEWGFARGYGLPEDLGDRGGRPHRRRRQRQGQRRGGGEGLRSDGDPGFGQSLPGDPGGTARKTSSTPRSLSSFGIRIPNQVVVMFHCGSRGFGHQVATDYLQLFLGVMETKYDLRLLDRELACAPFHSPEGQDYFAAMKCAIEHVLCQPAGDPAPDSRGVQRGLAARPGRSGAAHGLRRGAQYRQTGAACRSTASAGSAGPPQRGHPRLWAQGWQACPACSEETGQPVIIGGSMETGSYLLAGRRYGRRRSSPPHTAAGAP